ncbi:MAG: YHS domain-containing protein [Proteobacteria bacterium]|nr:YHS domain-containing protein [Pseudomonadota bacterium]
MESVLSVLVWGGLFFLMMRFGCGSHMSGHGAKHKTESGAGGQGDCCGTGEAKRALDTPPHQQLRWEAPEKDSDPVCGEVVSPAKAKSSVYAGQVYYFCSRECREAFEALPENYVGLGESHNVHRHEHTPDQGGNHG